MPYDLQREAEMLQEEIRDINAKSIQVVKIFSGVVLAFFAYVFFGLAAFAALSSDGPSDGSFSSRLLSILSLLLGKPYQSGIPKQMAFAAKIYSLTGILFTFTLLGAWLYLCGQWATSKRHRIRYWRQIHHIRNWLLNHDEANQGFRNEHCILPVTEDRPQISPRNRHFVWVSMIATCLFLVFTIVYFTFAWHIENIWHLHTEFDAPAAKVKPLREMATHLEHPSGEMVQQEGGKQTLGVDISAESLSAKKNTKNGPDHRHGPIVDAFWWIMAPSAAFLLIGVSATISFSVGNYHRFFLAEAVSHKYPYPRLPRNRRHIIRIVQRANLILLVFSTFAVLVLGAHAIPYNDALKERGITLNSICGLDFISGYRQDESISIWCAYGVFLGCLGICAILQAIRLGCVTLESVKFKRLWLRFKYLPRDGDARLASIRRIVDHGTKDAKGTKL